MFIPFLYYRAAEAEIHTAQVSSIYFCLLAAGVGIFNQLLSNPCRTSAQAYGRLLVDIAAVPSFIPLKSSAEVKPPLKFDDLLPIGDQSESYRAGFFSWDRC